MSIPRLQLAHITKRYPAVVANSDVSLTVQDGETHAVLWKNGKIIDLGLFEGGQTFAYAINTRGQIVGFRDGSGGPLLWEPRRGMRLETFGGPGGDAVDINAAGQVVGSNPTSTGAIHATLWTPK